MFLVRITICFPVEPYPKGGDKKNDKVFLKKRQHWEGKDV